MRQEKQLKTFKIKLFVKRKSDSIIEEGAWNEYYNSSLNHYDICLRITFVLSFYVVVIQKKKCRPRLVRNSFFCGLYWECPTNAMGCPTKSVKCSTNRKVSNQTIEVSNQINKVSNQLKSVQRNW